MCNPVTLAADTRATLLVSYIQVKSLQPISRWSTHRFNQPVWNLRVLICERVASDMSLGMMSYNQMETFSALLALCAGNSPVTGEFPAQRPVTWSFNFSLICAWINGWVNNGEAGKLKRHRAHYDVIDDCGPRNVWRVTSWTCPIWCMQLSLPNLTVVVISAYHW